MNDETVSTLNSLIETLKDGQAGFQSAAENVKDSRVKNTFTELASQRAQLARELQTEVQKLGGDAEQTGSVTATMHRGWINLKSVLGGGEKSILNEAERGEDVAVKSFEKALSDSKVSPDVAGVIRRQFASVKSGHDRVKALRDSWK